MADEPTDDCEAPRSWTRPDTYIVALARRRTARRHRAVPPRTEPDEPRFALSTLPFLLLMGALALIAAGLFILAWPGNRPTRPAPKVEANEKGVAKRGWLDDAKREFHD